MKTTSDEKILEKKKTRTLSEEMCADGTVRRNSLNPMNMCAERRVSSRTVGESTWPRRATLTSTHQKFGKERG